MKFSHPPPRRRGRRAFDICEEVPLPPKPRRRSVLKSRSVLKVKYIFYAHHSFFENSALTQKKTCIFLLYGLRILSNTLTMTPTLTKFLSLGLVLSSPPLKTQKLYLPSIEKISSFLPAKYRKYLSYLRLENLRTK